MTEFVLVHGTTQSPAGWDRLAAVLRARGDQVTTIDLSAGQPDWVVADYARAAAGQAGAPSGRRVLTGHSGAGVLLPAIAQATAASAMVWLAAYVPDLGGGQSMLADIQAHRDAIFHPDWLGVDPTSDPELARRFLFHDCDPETQRWALGTLRLFNPGPAVYQHRYQHDPAGHDPAVPWLAGVGRTCIVPTGDRTLQAGWMGQAARQRLGAEPVEIDAGQCPHVSQPAVLGRLLAAI
jgi:hypothetical protein